VVKGGSGVWKGWGRIYLWLIWKSITDGSKIIDDLIIVNTGL